MILVPYTSFFHDGSIFNIQHEKDDLAISMESIEFEPEDLPDEIVLSKYRHIKGILHFKKVSSIIIDDKPFELPLSMGGDNGHLYHFEIYPSKAVFHIEWRNYRPKKDLDTNYYVWSIEAEEILWENVPNLYDPFGYKE